VEAKLILAANPNNNNNGSVTWTYSMVDSAFDFIAAGETLTLTYTARVDNNFAPNNEAGFQSFTITITRGTNDVPVITTSSPAIAFSGGTSTEGGDLTSSGPTSGTLSFTDADLTDTHAVSVALTGAVLSNGGTVPPGPLNVFETALAASLATDSTGTGTGAINWSLADLPVFLADFIPKGETLTLTYTVTVTDSQNATTTKDITVTITGTDNPAVVWVATSTPDSTPGGLWSDAANWETGTVPTSTDDVIIITNQLIGLTPSFPVTIDTAAFAKSVTMHDFGSSAPELINQSSLTISGVLSLGEDSIVENHGTISVGGLMEVSNTSVLDNSGLLTLAQGGDFKDQSTISNKIGGTIDVTGGTLNVQVNISNAGQITVEPNAKLTVASAAIDGAITNEGEIDLTGAAVLKNGSLGNIGQIKVSGTGNALDNEIVTNSGSLMIALAGALTLEYGTTIKGGTLTNYGTLYAESPTGATLDGVTVENHGVIQVDTSIAGKLVVDDGTAITGGTLEIGSLGLLEVKTALGATLKNVGVDNSGVIQVDAGSHLELDGTTVTGGSLTNAGTVQIETSSASTLDDVNVANLGGVIQVDVEGPTVTLVLEDGTKITDGSLSVGPDGVLEVESVAGAVLDHVGVTNHGAIQVHHSSLLLLEGGTTITGGTVTIASDASIGTSGTAAIDAAVTNDGLLEIKNGSFDLTGSISGSGSILIDSGALFELNGSTTQKIQFSGDGTELRIDTDSFGGTIAGLEATDRIDLRSVDYSAKTTATFVSNANHDGGVLTVTDGVHSISMTLIGDYSQAQFAGSNDGSGETLITITDDHQPTVDTTSGSFAELAATTNSSEMDHAGGTVTFTDVDLTDRPVVTTQFTSFTLKDADGHDVPLTSQQDDIAAVEAVLKLTPAGTNANSGSMTWSYDVVDKQFDFLRAGETLTLTYTAKVDDGHGGVVTKPLTVTVTGANDAPTIVGETDAVTQAVMVLSPVTPIILNQGVNINAFGFDTETFDGRSTGLASNNGANHGSFHSDVLHASFSATGNAGVVNGSYSSVTAAPFIGPGIADPTNYLSVGAGAKETITFETQKNAFGLYWGSVDSFNTIDFYNGATLVAHYTGADISPLFANGNQGSFSSNGYVEFAGLAAFNTVVLGSGNSNAFEIDNISAGSVPQPHVQLAAPITGTLSVNDADVGDTLTASVTGNAVLKLNGSTHLPDNVDVSALISSHAITFDTAKSDGGTEVLHWTYDPDNPNLDFLKSGDTLTITFAAQVNDGHGNVGNQNLTVSIVGTDSSAHMSAFEVVSGTVANETFNDVGHGVTVFGGGGNDTFVFKQDFGQATIADFDVNNDSINISSSSFTSVAALLAAAHPVNSGQDTIITDAHNDTIKLVGVTVAQLNAHQGDFHIV
jgi:VCBS repeat-containing protein